MSTPGYRSCIKNIYTCSDTIEYTPDINIITSGGVHVSEAYISADTVEYIPYIDLNSQVCTNPDYRSCLTDTWFDAVDCGSDVNINTQGYNSSIIKSYICSDTVECVPDNTKGKCVQKNQSCSKKSYTCSDTIDYVPDININTQGSTGPTGPTGDFIRYPNMSLNNLYLPYDANDTSTIFSPSIPSTIRLQGTYGTDGSFIQMYDHVTPNNPIFNLISQNNSTNDYSLLTMGNGINTQNISMDGNIGKINANTMTGTTGSFQYLTTNIIGSSTQTDDITIYGSTPGTSNLFTNVLGGSITIGSSNQSGAMTINGSLSSPSNLFTNATSSNITIGNSSNSGTVTIHGIPIMTSFQATSSRPIITTTSNIIISNTSAITTGLNNIAIGNNALATATTSVQCVAIGNGALNKLVASNSTAVGHGALGNASGNNTAFGSIAGGNITSGNGNVCIGFSSLSNATTSSSNVAIGYSAGNNVTSTHSHNNCCFIGNNSNSNNTAGHSNSVAIGSGSIITGSNQIVMGQSSTPSGVVLPLRHILGVASPITSTINNATFSTFNILSISGNTMTTSGIPPLLAGMYISGLGINTGTIITSGSGSSWQISPSQTVGEITGTYNLPTYPLNITSISGTTMTISTSTYSSTLTEGTRIFGPGVPTDTTIYSGSGTTYTLTTSSTLGPTSGAYSSPTISINFPLSEIYYIVPQATEIFITLPNIASFNVGAKVTFRIVSRGVGKVTLLSNAINIFVGATSANPTETHPLYTGSNSNNLLTHTFMCLPTSIGNPAYAYGWFQLGTV
jgi:hypothetical protein